MTDAMFSVDFGTCHLKCILNGCKYQKQLWITDYNLNVRSCGVPIFEAGVRSFFLAEIAIRMMS